MSAASLRVYLTGSRSVPVADPRKHSRTVITYSSGRSQISICTLCERRHEAAGTWPSDTWGTEYCTVSHGEHEGVCDLSRAEARS